MDWITSALSPEQQQVLHRNTTNAVILAAAGSGKTRTLTHAVLSDLAQGIPPASVIAFTFTEKAASEMLARIHTLASKHMPYIDLTDMYVGTIHAWCWRYLQQQSEFYNFQPLDELHLDSLVSRLYDPLRLDQVYGKPFPRAVDDFLSDLEVFYNEHLSIDDVPDRLRWSIKTFTQILQQNRLITFGDMIRYATTHLKQHGPIPDLKCLYVDEYQDVNPAQVELIKTMARPDSRIVAVGDDLQCIYNWRGSDVTRILHFPSEFGNASPFRLSTNYRARPPIVQLANHFAETIQLRDHEKVMVPGRPEPEEPTIHWLSCGSEQEQADVVSDIISRFHSQGVPYNKIAIILRSVIRAGATIRDSLEAHGIPVNCPVLSRGSDFVNGFLIPVFTWLSREHREPRNQAEEREFDEAADALWEAVAPWLGNGLEEAFWGGLNDWLDAIDAAKNDAYNIRSWLYDFMDRCNLHVDEDDTSFAVGLGIASQIIRSVEEVHRHRLQGYNRRTPRGVMNEVLQALKRKQNEFGESVPVNTSADGVLITTVHQAKGLEWPVVILPMLVKGRFPLKQSPHGTSFPDDIAGRYGTTLEDERRLFYVACTRAKERLFLVDPVRNSPKRRSPFLLDLNRSDNIQPTSIDAIPNQVWRIKDEDLSDSEAPPIRIGLSDLLLYLECPYQYGLRRLLNIQPSVGDELGFGQGLHEVIQRRLESDDEWSDKDLEELVDSFVSLPYMSEDSETESKRVIKERLKALSEMGVFTGQVQSEIDVEVAFSNGIIHGIIDGIHLSDDKAVLIRDWKSSIDEKFLPRYERQLQFYAFALGQKGMMAQQAEIVDVAQSSKQGHLTTRQVNVQHETLDQLANTLEQSLHQIASGSFAPRPSHSTCSACDMKRICSKRQE